MKANIIQVQGLGDIYFRDASSDAFIIEKNLFSNNPEYRFPLMMKPKVIFDIGANIGIITVMLAKIYPEAIIYSFEPQAENFKLLEMNTKHLPNVKRFNFGLADDHGEFNLYKSSDEQNFGGFSFYKKGVDTDVYETCKLVDVHDFLFKEGADTGTPGKPLAVDLIKIDCEGSEFSILTAIPEETLKGVKFITGELHGEKDFELLIHLEKMGFDLEFTKKMNSRVWNFVAVSN